MNKAGKRKLLPLIPFIQDYILNAKGEKDSIFHLYGVRLQREQKEREKFPFWSGNIQI